jgi:hypothetical protein
VLSRQVSAGSFSAGSFQQVVLGKSAKQVAAALLEASSIAIVGSLQHCREPAAAGRLQHCNIGSLQHCSWEPRSETACSAVSSRVGSLQHCWERAA